MGNQSLYGSLTPESRHRMSRLFTVHLFRSGRVSVQQGEHTASEDVDLPLVTHVVELSDYMGSSPLAHMAVLGKLLLEYVDKANQPQQLVPLCLESCCRLCKCGDVQSKHTPANLNVGHAFDPWDEEPT
jgi:hypothetical protein